MAPDTPEREALCQRCGISCRAAVLVDGQSFVVEDLHCPFLVEEEGSGYACSVYPVRFEQAPWCMHSSVAGPMGELRKGCPYVSPNQPGKLRLAPEDYDEAWPRIRDALLKKGVVNPHFTWDKFFRAAERREPGYRWSIKRSWSGSSARIMRREKGWLRRLLGL